MNQPGTARKADAWDLSNEFNAESLCDVWEIFIFGRVLSGFDVRGLGSPLEETLV